MPFPGTELTDLDTASVSSNAASDEFDIVIIGGGINGAGIARDAAGRGLRVLLCEQDDLANHTSSASSKLIHGGLRYLEHYEFRLVAKALAEREVLLRVAPHIVRPLRFVMPHVPALRPRWMMRLGLFLYDHLDFRRHKLLPGSKAVSLGRHPAGAALRAEFEAGYEYSDAWVDDARLVVLNAVDAAERGADILTRTRCVCAARRGGVWHVDLDDHGTPRTVHARALVNAAGPWAGQLLDDVISDAPAQPLRLVKGSHIVLPRIADHDYAYILQNPDRRVVFALPFEGDFTLVGTTDVEYDGDPRSASITDAEIDYLCSTINRFFRDQVEAADIVHTFAGVRPLVGEETVNASAISRDYQLELDTDGAPLLSVIGGKITTYRKLADEAVDLLAPLLGDDQPGWTQAVPLPGGESVPADDLPRGSEWLARHDWLGPALAARLASAYGTRASQVLGDARSLEDLGVHFGGGLYERELEYLVTSEWATTAEDVLWRRTRLGLRFTEAEQHEVQRWLDKHREALAEADGRF